GSWTGGASLTPGRADARGSIMRWSGRCRLVAVASTPLQPGRRIHRLATAAQLDIERRPPVSAGTADPGDGVAAAHPLPGIAQQGVVVRVQAHVAIAMVHDQDQPVAGPP